jgi:hypothetical protein
MPRIATESEVQLAEAMDRGNHTAGDGELQVYFYKGAALDAKKSKEEKKPCFYDTTFVRIQVPGDRTMTFDQPAQIDEENEHNLEAHNNRFPRQWKAFKAGQDSGALGTPLTALTALSPARAAELAYFKVATVEQLAGLTDANLQRIGAGYYEERKRARAFLAAQKDTELVTEVQEELAKRDEQIETMKRQLEQLMAQASRGPAVETKPQAQNQQPKR